MQQEKEKKKKKKLGIWKVSVSMVHLGNGSSEDHQQKTVLGKEGEGRLRKVKMPDLRWRSRSFSP